MKRVRMWLWLIGIGLIGVLIFSAFVLGVWKNGNKTKTNAEIAADFLQKRGFTILLNNGYEYEISVPKSLSQFSKDSKIKRLTNELKTLKSTKGRT